MDALIGYFLVAVIPGILGLLAIIMPFRSHRATRQDRFLTLGVINAVLCGLALLALLASVVMNGYPSFLVYVVIAVGFCTMLGFEVVKKLNERSRAQAQSRAGN